MKNVLFIDDDEEYIYMIERCIKSGKIPKVGKMLVAYNGKEAIDLLLAKLDSEDLPQAIFVDINMPVMDGHQFLENFDLMREKHPILEQVKPVAVVTTSTSESDKKRIADTGLVKEYLIKDVNMNTLASDINRLLK